MDKVTKQRDPKRQAARRKGHEKYMAKLKEDILKNVGNDISSSATNSSGSGTNSSSNSTNDTTIGSTNTTNDTTNTISSSSTNFSYIHGVGAIAILTLGVYIFIIPKYLKKTTAQPRKSPEKISKIRRKTL